MFKKLIFDKFNDAFWKDYNEKNYKKLIDNYPKLLQLNYDAESEMKYQRLCIFTIISMTQNKSVDETKVKEICKRYQSIIANTNNPINALKYFICMEYVTTLSNFTKILDMAMLDAMATTVLNKLQSDKRTWCDDELAKLNRFVIVLVESESLLSLTNGSLPKFELSAKAIEMFCIKSTDDRKNCWPKYLLSMLHIFKSYQDEKADGAMKLLEKIKCLSSGKSRFKKDVAIMLSEILHASASILSNSSIQFTQYIFHTMLELYSMVRDKTCSPFNYILMKTYQTSCCDKMNTHAGLNILATSRTTFVKAMDRDHFSEITLSMMSNFAVAEAEILTHFACKTRENILCELSQALLTVSTNIDKVVKKCGLDRATRTLQKFLSIKILKESYQRRIRAALTQIYRQSNIGDEQIFGYAMELINRNTQKSRIRDMYDIHLKQKEEKDPEKIETISSIVSRIPAAAKLSNVDSTQLQLLQLTVEIDFPMLPATHQKKLVDDMCAMDFYRNDECCYANLNKCGICYLQCTMYIQQYKSKVKVTNMYQELNKDLVLLKSEIEIVKKLQESLDHLSKFVRDKDVWMVNADKDFYVKFAESMLQRISESLINRQYKDLAVKAFSLFYEFAKLMNKPLKQIYAAGFLVENIHLASAVTEVEIVTELQSNIMRQLKDVGTMSVDDLGHFLLAFLQLTMYTMRYQYNVEHAKKYMQAINKLLNKFDSEQEKYVAPRLKYAEVMFELILRDPDSSITPITYIEDIFHRFKNIRIVTQSDLFTVPGITYDLMSTLYAFSQPRFEFRYYTSLNTLLHTASLRNGYLFLFAKITIMTISEFLITSKTRWPDHMKQLDVLLECESSAEPKASEDEKVTWNKEITSLIHPDTCECFQCKNKYLNTLNMEAAAVKAWAVYFNKDYVKSLESFQQIYDQWQASNTPTYSGMLMNYSNCLISNWREDESKCILDEALDACNDDAQAQDISVRLLLCATKNEFRIKRNSRPSYAEQCRPKVAKPKIKINSKRTNIRN